MSAESAASIINILQNNCQQQYNIDQSQTICNNEPKCAMLEAYSYTGKPNSLVVIDLESRGTIFLVFVTMLSWEGVNCKKEKRKEKKKKNICEAMLHWHLFGLQGVGVVRQTDGP